ncbi:MAG: hypothetical protein IKJ70_00175 [Clostridia bacterium]|nr:hypothetical protein [Clostridia bacterium]
MNRKIKKITSLLLTLLLVFTALTPLAAAAETEGEKIPVIYVGGYGGILYKDKGDPKSKQIYPLDIDLEATVKEAAKPFLTELANGFITGNWDKYCDEIYNTVAPLFEELVLAPDGTPKDNSGRGGEINGKSLLYHRFSGGEAYLPYDWRVSVETSAEMLGELVDDVIAKNGVKKVNIIARCLAGNVLSAYLQNDPTASEKINKAIFFIPSTEGAALIGSIFSGKIELKAESIDSYAEEILKYKEVIDDPAVSEFLTVMLSIFEQAKLLGKGMDFLQDGLENIKDNIIPRLVRATYGSFPSFWAMVPHEYFEDALEFIYSTPELKEEYKGTIEKARSYHDNIQIKSREDLIALSDKIDISVISKYNLPLPPLFADCNIMSDGIAETERTSFGATAADYGKTLSASYIASMSEENKKFLSPDEKIDASTCLFPEKTWFIKNSYHDHFPDSIDVLLETILTSKEMTVFTNETYPQYLDAEVEGKTLTPVKVKDFEKPSLDSNAGKFNLLFRFITVILEFFKRLFAKV